MTTRAKVILEGVVQGVGYRPFINRLAAEYKLKGVCWNSTRGLVVEVEGRKERVRVFCRHLKKEHPPLAHIKNIRLEFLEPKGYKKFTIKESRFEQEQSTLISPDICICNDCLKELFDPKDRRYLYPFVNCTNCGPRFSIIKDIPYDRPFTTMNVFDMCLRCQTEYDNICDRRYHAQPNSCPECGPQISLLNKTGSSIKIPANDIIPRVIKHLLAGKVVLIKGIGGFHVACLASNARAVKRIRKYKNRPFKPLALMAGSIKEIRNSCKVSKTEEKLLTGPQRPIVLLQRKDTRSAGIKNRQNKIDEKICAQIAPNNNYLGFMLPYTPLHYLLMQESCIPALVMTSANAGDEPIIADDKKAVGRLKGLYDYILTYNRRIYNRCDDSIAAVYSNQPVILRRARGYTPLPLNIEPKLTRQILACGPELKNTFALGKDDYVYMSQHMGDLKTVEALEIYKESISRFKRMFKIKPEIIASDLHPDYLSTSYAWSLKADKKRNKRKIKEKNNRIIGIQHHQAHIAACMLEHGLRRDIIGISMDGTGYGPDGHIWGGEFFIVLKKGRDFKRIGHLKYTPLPGGDAASHQPWRMALSYLYLAFGQEVYNLDIDFIKKLGYNRVKTVIGMIKSGINSPLSSSCGRLFEAVGALLGLCQEQTYEAQSAIELEMMADRSQRGVYLYGFEINAVGSGTKLSKSDSHAEFTIDSAPIFKDVVSDIQQGEKIEVIAGKFHNTVVKFCGQACDYLREGTKISRVVLGGGVFQNRLFTEKLIKSLKNNGFEVFMNNQLPSNDGCVALGQLSCAAMAGDN
ncbi:MAG: carbamoyltransferase HypF [Candidatus Omnitrophica bacterium]|nr:carbamoyltransferase HypF [Candidatus Omnitrophota bacterium]